MAKHQPPIGDLDLGAPRGGDGGSGGNGFASTGALGGMPGSGDKPGIDRGGDPDEFETSGLIDSPVQTSLGDIVGGGTSDADGSALDQSDDAEDEAAGRSDDPGSVEAVSDERAANDIERP